MSLLLHSVSYNPVRFYQPLMIRVLMKIEQNDVLSRVYIYIMYNGSPCYVQDGY